jgi:hypothetical protein
MRRGWWTFRGFVDEREEELRRRFLDTCNHEGGHLLLAADLAIDAVREVRVDQPRQGETFEGVTGVDLRRVAPEVVPLVALAGCMAEAKRGAEQLFRMGATFSPHWDTAVNFLWLTLAKVSPRRPDQLFYQPFTLVLEDGQQVPGCGYFTAIDLLHIPEDVLRDDELLERAMTRTAQHLDRPENWRRCCAMADALAGNPGRVISRDEALGIMGKR